MRWFWSLLSVLGFVASAQAQTPTMSGFFGAAGGVSELAVIKQFGGLNANWATNEFIYQDPVTHTFTDYVNFNTMWTTYNGTMTSGPKWCFDKNGTLFQIPANTPAQPCYDSNGQLIGLQWELQATNFFLQSNDFTQAAWTKTGLTVTAAAIKAPTGTNIASKLVETTANSEHAISQAITKTAAPLTFNISCFVTQFTGVRRPYILVDDGAGKKVRATYRLDPTQPTVEPDIDAGGFTNVTVRDWYGGIDLSTPDDPIRPNGDWDRIALTFTTTSTTTLNVKIGMLGSDVATSYPGDGTSSLGFYECNATQSTQGGSEVELWPTSVIPTTTTTVTRPRDQLIKMDVPANMGALPGYSFLSRVTPNLLTNGIANVFWVMSDTAQANRFQFSQSGNFALGSPFVLSIVDGATQVSLAPLGVSNYFGAPMSIAAVTDPGHYWIQNGAQATRTSAATTFPSTTRTTFQFGALGTSIINQSHGGMAQFMVVAKPLPTVVMRNMLFNSDTPPFNPDAILPPDYFTADMIDSCPSPAPATPPPCVPGDPRVWDVMVLTTMPKSDAEPYITPPVGDPPVSGKFLGNPLNHAWNNQIPLSKNSSSTKVKFRWISAMYKCTLPSTNCYTPFGGGVLRPNGSGQNPAPTIDGRGVAIHTTTYERAAAWSLAQSLAVAGYPDHATGACTHQRQVGQAFRAQGSGTTLTVTMTNDDTFLYKGYILAGPGIPAGTKIVDQVKASQSGTISAAGQTVTLALPVTPKATIRFSNFDTGTVEFEKSSDGGVNWTPAVMIEMPYPETPLTSAVEAGNHVFQNPLDGSTHLRVRATAYSGTATDVVLSASAGYAGGDGTYTTDNPTTATPTASNVTVTVPQKFCGYLDPLVAVGYNAATVSPPGSDHFVTDVAWYADIFARPTNFFPTPSVVGPTTWMTNTDKVILPSARLSDFQVANGGGGATVWGSMCDCEGSDNRPASLQTDMLLQLQLIYETAGYNFTFGTNSLFGAGQAAGHCGKDVKYPYTTCDVGPRGNLGILVNFVTEFWQGVGAPKMTTQQSLEALDGLLGPSADRRKVMQAFSLGPYPSGLRVSDAKIVREWALKRNFKGVAPLTIFNIRGGNEFRCTNQKVQMFLFGHTSEPLYPEC